MLIKELFKVKPPDTSKIAIAAFKNTFGEKYFKPSYQFVNQDTFLGIEIEVEHIRNHIETFLWTIKEDGSLRNHGVEYVSPPLKPNLIGPALNALYDLIPVTHQFSQRTSIHVHMNVQDFTEEQLYRLFIIYLTFEPLIYQWVGKDRDENIFCRPWYQVYELNAMIKSLQILSNVIKNIGYIQHTNKRYSGLNFESLQKFGTIEFRQLGGTDNIITIIKWINIILSLKVAALKYQTDTLIARINNLNTKSDYHIFTQEIFDGLLLSNDVLLELGSTVVKKSLISNQFLKELDLNDNSSFHRACLNMKVRTNLKNEIPRAEEVLWHHIRNFDDVQEDN